MYSQQGKQSRNRCREVLPSGLGSKQSWAECTHGAGPVRGARSHWEAGFAPQAVRAAAPTSRRARRAKHLAAGAVVQALMHVSVAIEAKDLPAVGTPQHHRRRGAGLAARRVRLGVPAAAVFFGP
eukprot:362203-Chlamydomonas_euryale.AAC.1